MGVEDLETYQVQLSQVELALSADPEDTELQSLRDQLKELIELTQASIAASSASKADAATKKAASTPAGASASSSFPASSASASSSAPAPAWAAGDEVLAKYSGDGQWYPARITSVGGSAERRAYSVVFKGYNNTELVSAPQVKPLPAGQGGGGGGAGAGAGGAGVKRKLSKEEEEERERKKKKNEKKVEVRAAKAKDQQNKQASWQKFAKKSEKKGIHIAGVAGTSIFKTPENPLGRVGVTGSGKGMTETATRVKHKFEVTDDPNA
ncbi:uncharacterized protein BXZ73DRAFT_39231 [Epithele typhae]|uniref:uncharacterized protein n=1 Tax=Epithele typhae TaxID=378194 RepID=UPI0020072C72|nr:uncharacterized protein BXZ73DRAFT_39231 [Epithele typhae]KAH9944081.1 hypothetical protein BXZ73DRAFT_39231 [Epithele typhae]